MDTGEEKNSQPLPGFEQLNLKSVKFLSKTTFGGTILFFWTSTC
jgi:hypothetical protein